ncbi:MAG: MerR family transcriptional regulator [Oceanococcaceae bacterium]
MNETKCEQHYRIGAVERLTGIPAVTIRMWERRYGVVEPERTPANGRLYSRSQLSRLVMLKQLVDGGHAISTIAALSDAELSERVGALATFRPQREGPVAVVTVGSNLSLQARDAADEQDTLLILGSYDDADAALASNAEEVVDALVIELPIVAPETVRLVGNLTAHFSASVTMVVYQFGSAANIAQLHRAGYHTVTAPVRLAGLAKMLPALVGVVPMDDANDAGTPADWIRQPPPTRRYTALELHRWAKRSSSVQCECPEHLTALISRLIAFEDYSRDCESRNPADAAVHLLLHHTTAHARRALEDALAHLIAHEFGDEAHAGKSGR